MAAQNNDDVARALAALAGGAVPSEHETPSGGIPSESTVFDPQPVEDRPAVLGEVPLFAPNAVPSGTLSPSRTAKPPAAVVRPPMQPATPVAARSVTQIPVPPTADKTVRSRPPAASPTSPPIAQPAVPPAPVVPPMPALPPVATIRQSLNSKRPAAPTRPSVPAPRSIAAPPPSMPEAIEEVVPAGDMLSEITDDDDVIAPAPDLSAFTPKVRPAKLTTHLYEQTNFRRTIIPVLLTGGVLLIALGTWSQLDRAGILGSVGTGIGILFVILGVALLGVGVLNMLQVKHILKSGASAD